MLSWTPLLLLLLFVTVENVASLPLESYNRRTPAVVCNGRPEFCDRSYGNITFAGAHDSYAYSIDPFALGRNQEIDIPTQLGSGIRLLQAQSHMDDGVLHFCHTSCLEFDGGTVEDFLKTVKTFLDANPTEVVTLLFTNPEGVAVDTVWDPIFQSSGIAGLAYAPPSVPVKQSEWPTLGQLVDNGKQLVVFMDEGSDPSKVPYILPEFDMIWENPFDSIDPTFPCSISRIRGTLDPTDHMSLLNHFLDFQFFGSITIPDLFHASRTNGVPSILADASGCAPLNGGRNPNFLLFDWVNIGAISLALDQLNGLA